MGGKEIPLQSIFLSSTEPLYHKALGGIPITAALPGLLTDNQPARIFNRVKLDINAFEDAYSLARHRDLHDYCYIEGTNPLNVSLTFYKIEVDIFYDGEWIGDVHVPPRSADQHVGVPAALHAARALPRAAECLDHDGAR